MLKYDVVIGRTTNSSGTAVDVNALEITEYKSEELDFGVFTIPATTRFENFQILDRVDIEVTDGSNTKVYDPFLVISDEVTPVSKEGLFKHTVTFIEDIHKFEKILSGNVFITQPLTGTKKTLLDVMNHIRDVVPFERASVHSATRLFEIDSNLATFLDDIEAPQFFFTGMNLREMINAVASFVNAIGRMEENRNLVFSFYNEILNLFDIDEESIYKTLKNQTKYFTSSLESNIENATGADDEERALIIHPNPDGFISMRSTDVKLTDETFEFRVPYPIERLVKVEYKVKLFLPRFFEVENVGDLDTLDSNTDWTDGLPGRQLENTFFKVTSSDTYYVYNATGTTAVKNGVEIPNETFFEVFPIDLQVLGDGFGPVTFFEVLDVTTHIYEFNNYKRLDLDVADSFTRRQQDRQSNTMHFQINGTVISNNRLFGLFDGANVIENFYLRVTRANGFIFTTIPVFDTWDEQEYRITYVPYFGTRVRLNKDDVTDHPYNTQMSANQGERIVSAERLLRNIYGMAQRLGQDEIEFKRFYTDLSELFNLGQITADGFVIASRHITYYINYFMVTYQLSKNFNRFANRIALNQENRPFDISLGSKTTTRNLLYNEYVELDTEAKANTSLIRSTGVNTFMNTIRPTFDANFDKPIQYGIFAGAELADTQSNEGVLLHPIAFSEGNSLNFYWSFDDVIKAGDQLAFGNYSKPDTFLGIPVAVKDVPVYNNRLVRYTGENEELNSFELSMGFDLPNIEPNDLPVVPLPDDTDALIGGHSNNGVFNDNFIVNKDKSEILSMNYVLSVVPNFRFNNKIIVGRELTHSNNLIIANKNANLLIYTSENETYNSLENRFVKGTATAHTYTITIESQSGVLLADIPNISELASWAIGDDDGNLYLGVNVTDEVSNNIYFNFKNKRENISYTFDDIDVLQSTAPRNLVLTPSETSILAEWEDDPLGPFETFQFGIRRISPLPITDFTFGITTNSFANFTNLAQGATFQVRVRSNRSGVLSFYNTQSATTIGDVEKVEGFALTRSLSLTQPLFGAWNALPGVTGYNAESRRPHISWTDSGVVSQTLGANQTTASFAVGVNNILVARVRGQNAQGFGPFSDEDIEVRPLFTGQTATVLSDTVIETAWDALTNLVQPTVNQEIGTEIRTTEMEIFDTGTTTGIGDPQFISDGSKSFTPNSLVGKSVYIVDGPRAGKSSIITSNTNIVINFSPQIESVVGDLQNVDYVILDKKPNTTVTTRELHTVQTANLTALTPSTFYDVDIRAYFEYQDINFGKTVFSDSTRFALLTLDEFVAVNVIAPSLSDTANFPTNDTLRWNIFNPNAFSVQLAAAINQELLTEIFEQGSPTTLAAGATTTFTQSNVPLGQSRTLFAQFREGTSPNFSFSTVSSRTQTTVPPPPPPVPTGLQVTNITQNSARASWNQVSTAINGYDVLVNNEQPPFSLTSSFVVIFDITGLVPNTFNTVQVRSRSVDGSGPSAYSAAVGFNTLSGPPVAPATATFSKTADFNWSLSWSSVTGATSYDYQLSTSSNFSEGTIVVNQNTASTSATGTVPTGARHYARVRAVNASGVSAYRLADPTGGIIMGPDGEL